MGINSAQLLLRAKRETPGMKIKKSERSDNNILLQWFSISSSLRLFFEKGRKCFQNGNVRCMGSGWMNWVAGWLVASRKYLSIFLLLFYDILILRLRFLDPHYFIQAWSAGGAEIILWISWLTSPRALPPLFLAMQINVVFLSVVCPSPWNGCSKLMCANERRKEVLYRWLAERDRGWASSF